MQWLCRPIGAGSRNCAFETAEGANRFIGTEKNDDELRSPFTGHLMKRFKYREVELDYCEFTDSVWFDRGEYSKMFQSPEGAKRMKGVGQDVVDSVGVGEIADSVADVALDFSMVGEFVGDFLSNFEVTWDPWD